ncbi:MAG: SDR family oxidoreductase [Acidobacteria bacterium]|nr:SDR family oxidoreductase [Acidobacteriota bacterium]
MDLSLTGKAALVCAASKGLGRAAAMALAREGARVAICARGAETLAQTADELRSATGAEVLPIVADVALKADVSRLVQEAVAHFGGLDILVTNAGGPKSGPFSSLSDEDWQRAVDQLLLSVVRLCAEVVPHMKQRGGGRIIHVTSVAVKQPVDNLMLSNSIRAAVVGFSKTLATEVAKDRILVNCVAPGYTRTDRVKELLQAGARRENVDESEIERRLVAGIPLGRMGDPDEFGSVVAFLASERASFITGTVIPIDGGSVKGLL